VKKKAKPKAKVARTTRALRIPNPIPADFSKGRMWLEAVKDCVKTFEQTTGAKANQTRLIDFVRWCEDNSGLL